MLKKYLTIKTLKKKKLSKKLKKKIFELKMEDYKYNLKQQALWFDENIGEEDIHNLLFYDKILIGYNCLRKIELNKKSRKYFFLFDTLLIKKKYRNFGFSNKIMNRSNYLIKNKNFFSILFCKVNMISYYEKFGWKKMDKSMIKSNKQKKLTCMNFNKRNNIKKILL